MHSQESQRRTPATAERAELKWLSGVTRYGAVGVVDTDRTMHRTYGAFRIIFSESPGGQRLLSEVQLCMHITGRRSQRPTLGLGRLPVIASRASYLILILRRARSNLPRAGFSLHFSRSGVSRRSVVRRSVCPR